MKKCSYLRLFKLYYLFFLLLSMLLLSSISHATDPKIVIGTKVAEPFAMKDKEGNWYGISIELWEKIAKELNLDYEWQELSLDDLLNNSADGSIDLGIAAITITALREQQLDFSHSYFTTGLSIASKNKSNNSWQTLLSAIFSRQILYILLGLAGILFFIGTLAWLSEKKQNPKNFNPNPIRGIGAGMWWAAVTMTTVGYGDMTPRTILGRIIALFWMFASLLLVSMVIAAVASTLTLAKIEPMISSAKDLHKARVATIENTTSDNYLIEHKIKPKYFDSISKALDSLEKDDIDAVVYDASLLKYLTKQNHEESIFVLDNTFDRQNYGIAFPENSPLREPVNRILLKIIISEEWQRVLTRYLGD